jgi:hypothetical protein
MELHKVMFILLYAMLVPTSLVAVDGVVLINQATVMAAGGFPYNITQSESYKLSGNLVVSANVNNIVISADNVQLDLNGFTVSGPGTCDGRAWPSTALSRQNRAQGMISPTE